jgi:hypothetical protein
MQKQTDIDATVSIVNGTKIFSHNLTSCSSDKRFSSRENVNKLSTILDLVTLPKKGKPAKE